MKLTVAIAIFVLAAAGSARAQMDSREGIALQNEILDLRAQLQQLQQSQGQGGGAPGYPSSLPPPSPDQNSPYGAPPPGGGVNSDTAAQLVVRVGNLEDQVRELQGKVDDLTNQLQRQNDTLSKQIGDLQFKLGQGPAQAAGGGNPNPAGDLLTPDAPEPAPHETQAERPAFTPPPPPPAPRRSAENALREGNAALARRDYAAAAAAAHEVLANHGAHGTDAQFLLARAETGEHKYREAAADYYLAYNRDPKASGAPIALLGVANALIDMNDKGDACQALAKLGAEFPKMPAPVHTAEASARKRAACR